MKSIHAVVLCIWADQGGVKTPTQYDIQYYFDSVWKDIPNTDKDPIVPAANKDNIVTFESIKTSRIRIVMTHQKGSSSGLTELEVYGND